MKNDLLGNTIVNPIPKQQMLQQRQEYHQHLKNQQQKFDAEGKMYIPYLKHYAINLNQAVKEANKKNGAPIKYAVGRRSVLGNVLTILLHKNKTTPMLLGEAGVGKTDIVEGVADALNRNKVPRRLQGYQIYELNIGILDVGMGTNKLGYIANNLSHIIKECKRYKNRIILFVDEFQILAKMNVAQYLKVPLSRGQLKMIGATTYDEFFDFVSGDRAMQRRLKRVRVQEPDKKVTYQIIRDNVEGYKNHYEKIAHYRNLSIDDDTLKMIVKLSSRYMPNQYQPDKAFDILDDTLANTISRHSHRATIGDVSMAIMHSTGIPMSSIALALQPQVANLSEKLHQRIKGQDHAITTVVNAIDMFYAGLSDPSKPNASFLFLGTTGVGKTEMAKAIAKDLFGSEHDMIRLDMASFNTADASAKLVGRNGKRGILTEAVRRQPYGVLLLDEIEKSYKSVWDLLLSILDDGELQDSRGRTVDFSNLIIIMTSNLASDAIKTRRAFMPTYSGSPEARKAGERLFGQMVDSALRRTFKPELVNRLSNRVIFNILDKPQIILIAKKYIHDLVTRLHRQGYYLLYDFNTIDYVTDLGTDVDNGARPLQRAINHNITGPISRLIIQMKYSSQWESKWKYKRTFVIYTKGKHPSKTDLYGNRQIYFGIRSKKPTKTEIKKQNAIFNKKNIQTMIRLYNNDFDSRKGFAAQVKDNIKAMKNRHKEETI